MSRGIVICMNERKKSGIYIIRNKLNGKSYIGQAISIGDRWYTHKSHLNIGRHHNRHLQSSWAKHGEQAFEFRVLEYVKINAQLLTDREQYWIDRLRPEYNIAPAAGSCIGLKHPPRSEEFRKKMSVIKKGFRHSPETIERLRQITKEMNYSHSPEVRKRISESQKGRKMSAEHLEKLRAINTGRKQSPEHIAKRVKKLIGLPCSDYTKKRIAEANRARLLGTKQSPELIEKRIAPLRGRPRPPEIMSIAHEALRIRNERRSAEIKSAILSELIKNPMATNVSIEKVTGYSVRTIRKYRKELQCQKPMPSANASGAKSSPQKMALLSMSRSSAPQQLSLPLG